MQDIIDNISSPRQQKSFEESAADNDDFKVSISHNISNIHIQDKDRKRVVSLLSTTPISYDALAEEAQLSLPVIYTICLELELAGKIIRYPGNKVSLSFSFLTDRFRQ